MEEKYYTYSIISEAKDLQNSVFAEAAKTGNFVTSFDYLLDTLAFASFDQTLSDILDFLKFEI
ncbi:MAG: hypothetical protein IPH89_12580 [Bacteroidetes bacterium]|nr:hypothetical protein [Bacteroidota bacterium]